MSLRMLSVENPAQSGLVKEENALAHGTEKSGYWKIESSSDSCGLD